VAYSPSEPLRRWLLERRAAIDVLAGAHLQVANVRGPGRPREIGRPLAHAYLIRVVSEFQGFVRDLHDLATEKLVELSGVAAQHRTMLSAGLTAGRLIDRGNADLQSLRGDFLRLGVPGLAAAIARHDPAFLASGGSRGDQASLQELIELRNALAHGNRLQLSALRQRGVVDTLSWARGRLPGLTRVARALDRVVWDHLHATFGRDPW